MPQSPKAQWRPGRKRWFKMAKRIKVTVGDVVYHAALQENPLAEKIVGMCPFTLNGKEALSGKEKAVVRNIKLCKCRHRKDGTACRRCETVSDR